MQNQNKQRTVRLPNRDIVTIGAEQEFWSDIYHRALTTKLQYFLTAILAVFVANNFLFACLYAVDENAVANVGMPHFLNLFFFTVEAFTTVGFGDMHAQNNYGHMIYSLEGFTALLETAALTGLIFARFSRPRARIRFAEAPVIANYEGQPTLMIRLANARHNTISDAAAMLWVLRTETSVEGQRFRRFHALKLIRNENPAFILSWTLFHIIDGTSLLHGLTLKEFEELDLQFILTFTGTDETSAQDLRGRRVYGYREIKWDHHYADILIPQDNGGLILDYRKFDQTEPHRQK